MKSAWNESESSKENGYKIFLNIWYTKSVSKMSYALDKIT